MASSHQTSFEEYCKEKDEGEDSEAGKNMTATTRNYYNQFCALQKRISKNTLGTVDPFKRFEQLSFKVCGEPTNNPDKFSHMSTCIEVAEFVEKFTEVADALVVGMLSPEFISIWGGMRFFHLLVQAQGSDTLVEGITKAVAEGAEAGKRGIVSGLFDETVSMVVSNLAVLLNTIGNLFRRTFSFVFRQIFEEATVDMLSTAATWLAASATYYADLGFDVLLSAGELALPVVDAFFILQLVGTLMETIFDAWDPCDFKDQINAPTMAKITTVMNEQFRNAFLSGNESFVDPLGNVFIRSGFPMEYALEQGFLQGKIGQDKFDERSAYHTAIYLQNLRTNSVGEPIVWPHESKAAPLVTQSFYNRLGHKIGRLLSGGNTRVSNWLQRFSPVVIAVLAVLVIFCVYLLI